MLQLYFREMINLFLVGNGRKKVSWKSLQMYMNKYETIFHVFDLQKSKFFNESSYFLAKK